jgi:hypothetical protein
MGASGGEEATSIDLTGAAHRINAGIVQLIRCISPWCRCLPACSDGMGFASSRHRAIP